MAMVMMALMVAFFAPVAVLLRRSLPGHHGLSVVIDRLHVTDLRGWRLPRNHRWLIARDRVLVIRGVMGVGRVGRWHRALALLRVALVGDTRTNQAARARAEDGTVAAAHGLANGGAGDCAHTGTQKGVHIVCMGLWGQTCQGARQQRKRCQGAQLGNRGVCRPR